MAHTHIWHHNWKQMMPIKNWLKCIVRYKLWDRNTNCSTCMHGWVTYAELSKQTREHLEKIACLLPVASNICPISNIICYWGLQKSSECKSRSSVRIDTRAASIQRDHSPADNRFFGYYSRFMFFFWFFMNTWWFGCHKPCYRFCF